MLVCFGKYVVNLRRVHSFWKADTFDDGSRDLRKGWYIKFNDSEGKIILDPDLTCIPFDTEQLRDEAFRDILFAAAEGKEVFAVIKNQEEKKP